MNVYVRRLRLLAGLAMMGGPVAYESGYGCGSLFALAFAQPATSATSANNVKFTPVVLKVEGREGVWWPTDQAGTLLKLRERTPLLEERVKLLEAQNDALRSRVRTATQAAALAEGMFRLVSEGLDRCEERHRAGRSWAEAPLLWLAIGAGATVGVAYALPQQRGCP